MISTATHRSFFYQMTFEMLVAYHQVTSTMRTPTMRACPTSNPWREMLRTPRTRKRRETDKRRRRNNQKQKKITQKDSRRATEHWMNVIVGLHSGPQHNKHIYIHVYMCICINYIATANTIKSFLFRLRSLRLLALRWSWQSWLWWTSTAIEDLWWVGEPMFERVDIEIRSTFWYCWIAADGDDCLRRQNDIPVRLRAVVWWESSGWADLFTNESRCTVRPMATSGGWREIRNDEKTRQKGTEDPCATVVVCVYIYKCIHQTMEQQWYNT